MGQKSTIQEKKGASSLTDSPIAATSTEDDDSETYSKLIQVSMFCSSGGGTLQTDCAHCHHYTDVMYGGKKTTIGGANIYIFLQEKLCISRIWSMNVEYGDAFIRPFQQNASW